MVGSAEQLQTHAYQWTPDTGSAMYCMPKVGTKVTLYFPDNDDKQPGQSVV